MTATAPAFMTPQNAMNVWGRFGSMMETRSPGLTPRRRSEAASFSANSFNSL